MILGFPKRIRIQVESAVSVPLRGVSFQPRFKGGKDAGKIRTSLRVPSNKYSIVNTGIKYYTTDFQPLESITKIPIFSHLR